MSKGITEEAKLDGKQRLLGKKALEGRRWNGVTLISFLTKLAGWKLIRAVSRLAFSILANIFFLAFLYEQSYGTQIWFLIFLRKHVKNGNMFMRKYVKNGKIFEEVKNGKCVSANPPSSAFPPSPDWDSYIYFRNKSHKIWSKIQDTILEFVISKISIHIFRASRGWVERKCKFTKNAISSTNWTLSEMLIGAKGFTKNYYIASAPTRPINKIKFRSFLLGWRVQT